MSTLAFQPFSSTVDILFWRTFSEKKLEIFKLSDKPVDILGQYPCGASFEGSPSALSLDAQAFDKELRFFFLHILNSILLLFF